MGQTGMGGGGAGGGGGVGRGGGAGGGGRGGDVPVKVTRRLAEAKTSWALASLSLISFASYYRFTRLDY